MKHLDKTQRQEIEILLQRGYTQTDIARVLNVHRSTICRELQRNLVCGVYNSQKAHHKSYVRRKYSKFQCMKISQDMKLRRYVETHIKLGWTPEQVAGRIAQEQELTLVSHTSIYKYIRSTYGVHLEQYLKPPKRKSRVKQTVHTLENRLFIDERPESINRRETYGHWEGDFIVSGKGGSGSLLVLYERKSKYTLVRRLHTRSINEVHITLKQMISPLSRFDSLTLDNDISFRKHEAMSDELDTTIYFCHPYHSWEKGGVEYTNSLIRRFVPKGCDISEYSDEEILQIQMWLNSLPRKILDFKTPEEVMLENNQLIVSPLVQFRN